MHLESAFGSYELARIPKTNKGDLRAWDAADEYLLQHFFDSDTATNGINNLNPVLVLNDAFGALSTSLHRYTIHTWSDSYLAHLATETNRQINTLVGDIQYIPSTHQLEQNYQHVLIKVPKTLALLEDQLYRLKPHLNNDSMIIAAGMSKHVHTSTLNLFEKIIGTTTTSRAVKKSRLIFCKNDKDNVNQSPYPKLIRDSHFQLMLKNHANVFSQGHLDIGSRFFLEQLKHCPQAENIIDLGCGNGVLGLVIKRHQPQAQLHFVDESYMAIASARANYEQENPDDKAHYYHSHCLEQYTGDAPDLILCNPPFHQAHSVGDQIAWQMFKQSHESLIKGGEFWVIGNRHLGYHAKLKRLFGQCKNVSANKKFVVLSATKT